MSGIDVIEAIRLLLRIYVGEEHVDDIDHLGSRRVRTAGELSWRTSAAWVWRVLSV